MLPSGLQHIVCKEILQWQKAWSCPEAQPINNTQRCTVFCQAKTPDKLEARMEIFNDFFSVEEPATVFH